MGCGFSKRQGVLYLATEDTIHKAITDQKDTDNCSYFNHYNLQIAYDRMIPVRTLEEQIALAIGFNRYDSRCDKGTS